MFLRGIQIIGLLVAFSVLLFIFYARRKGRLNSRSFLFWITFWGIFLVLDLFPSLVSYFIPVLSLETNMYILTAGSILMLFVLVFALYSFLSDLNQKVNTLVREQAIISYKLNKLMDINEQKENEK